MKAFIGIWKKKKKMMEQVFTLTICRMESDENQPSHDEVPNEQLDEESQSPPQKKNSFVERNIPC